MRSENLKAPVGRKVRAFLPVRVQLEHNQVFMGDPTAKPRLYLFSRLPLKCDRPLRRPE